MALTVDIDQTVTVLAEDGSAVEVVIPAGTYDAPADATQAAALELLWSAFLATDPERPQVVDEERVPLPGTEAPTPTDPPVVDEAPPATDPAPATDTPVEG